MKKKGLALLLSAIFISVNIYSQTYGISASKLSAINAKTVLKDKIEFEPSFGFSVFMTDSLPVYSDLGFRFTYGLTSKTEMGIVIPVNLSTLNWGIKYNAVNFKQYSVAFIAGIQNSLNSDNQSQEKTVSLFHSYSGGAAFTYLINKKMSVDFTCQLQSKFHHSHKDLIVFFNFETGYFITNGLQFVTGICYNRDFTHKQYAENITINSGITLEKAKNFILVLNFPYQLKNRYSPASIGFALALTMLIE